MLAPSHIFLIRADGDTHHRHPSYVYDAEIDAFKKQNLFCLRGMPFRWTCYGLGGVNHNANGF